MKNCKTIKKLKICRVATVPFALLSYSEHLELLQENNLEVTLVTSEDSNFELLKKIKVSRVSSINISRDISLLQDFISLFRLYFFFKKHNFDIIHSNTPKAGLLVSIAGFLTKSKVIHSFTGQRWETLSGAKRYLLILCDKLIVKLNKKTFCDSPSQRDYLILQGIGNATNIYCLSHGSFAGVNLNRFNHDKFKNCLDEIYTELNIPPNSYVISYVGRIVKDKGIIELLDAFTELSQIFPHMALLLIGPNDDISSEIGDKYSDLIKNSSNIFCTGYTKQPEKYLSVSKIFCLPSYREGFGTVIIEAAAMKIPSIGSDITGLRDAILHMKTGILVPSHDSSSLVEMISLLHNDEELRSQMGESALKNVQKNYSHIHLTNAYLEEYHALCLQN